ncbi:hypothetical protein R1sor_002876 [Riccia sorocarpa]|uniref:Glutamyl/glutaminyl-tRNA synthetase class Ib catalytic domain-containing protein n=1 Tax=Riccia sorocarpa TaxID=122646 RepID=A0ABD3H2S0_9MARC
MLVMVAEQLLFSSLILRILHSPDIGGEYGPYRQSERNDIYQQYVEMLLKSGNVYRCFCSDEVRLKLTLADCSRIAELAKGTPFTYRFCVPQEGSVTINDLIRGEVSWNQDTLGDFVVLRSNGQPVYNFCVAVDDATMKITPVIRLNWGATSIVFSWARLKSVGVCSDPTEVRIYEERHRGLQQEIAESFGRTRAEEDLRHRWELLRKYDASEHSLAALRISTHEVVTRIDLKMLVLRGNVALWRSTTRDGTRLISRTTWTG